MTVPDGRLATFATALDDCHEQAVPGGTVPSRTGWTVASAARLDGTTVPGSAGTLAARRETAPAAPEAYDAFCTSLLHLQRRTLREVLDAAVARLDVRESEGTPLLGRQLVRGAVAEVALALSLTGDLLALPASTPERRHRVHRELVAAGRTVLKLYGAHGFTTEGPGPLLHSAELLGNTYLHPGDPERQNPKTEAAHA